MQIPFIPPVTHEPSLLVSAKDIPALQVGEILQAEVLTVTETMVAVRMKNSILEARTNLPLQQGDVLSLLVEEAGQEIRLRLLSGGSGAASLKNVVFAALNTLKEVKPAADDIRVLTTFLANVPRSVKDLLPELDVLEKLASSPEGLTGSVLKAAVRDSGVLFETKLRLLLAESESDVSLLGPKMQALLDSDMKAALLSLKRSLGRADILDRLLQSGVSADSLSAAVDNLLKNTELLQLQSKLDGTLQVFVPFVWRELKDGELVFSESPRDWPEENASLCTVNLDLERAGRLSARLLLQGGQLYIDILAESEAFFRILQDNAGLLRNRLTVAGLRLGGLTIHQTDRIEIKPPQAGGLSIRI
jgi:hypothetical protein